MRVLVAKLAVRPVAIAGRPIIAFLMRTRAMRAETPAIRRQAEVGELLHTRFFLELRADGLQDVALWAG